ncbi:MAG TPA: hypothetical protein VJ506_05945, partial [Candidatus Limnocylindrales bacterium]|nr:hypothetical protein [Candidatus Limnocylindrales bacterium]
SRAIVGPLTRHLLEELHVDRALMGTYALSLDEGLSTTDPSEAFTKQLAMTRAGQVILLADSSKLGSRSFAASGRLADIDVLVTDARIQPGAVRRLTRLGVRVVKA